MTESTTRPPTRLCPTCGSRVAEGAARCVVCGTILRPGASASRRGASQVTLSFPLAVALLAAFALLAAGLTYVAVRATGLGAVSEPTGTPSVTPTVTETSEPTATEAPTSTPTLLPPIEHKVAEGETCLALAGFFGISVQSIVELNNLSTTCLLAVGQTILIPQPTPTALPPPTETLSPAEATDQACDKLTYTVQDNDTLSGIAENYNVSIQGIMDYNGMTSQNVFSGQVLIIPLCERLPTPGPSPTATPPPPYPAPNLLLPRDGAVYTLANDTITLQWAAVGPLRSDEAYQVIIEDITEGSGTVRLAAQVTDTKYIVPVSFRPNDALPHILRWYVVTVRNTGTLPSGEARWEEAGALSLKRDFTWSGSAPAVTPTP
ncbi:MAG TPA: LysM peptidoglycan-binding domain-containing protein [Anaerolineales bacterium]|nr:LysM peptidoglycan-binding domain-containing protein [Anaerolineales bacterium]